MKKSLFFLLVFVLLVAGSPFASAQPGFLWTQTNAGEYALWQGGVQIGSYRVSDDSYFPRFGPENWGESCPIPNGAGLPPGVKIKAGCPCCGDDCRCAAGRHCGKPNCPCVIAGGVIESDGTLNFGVKRESVPGVGPKRTHNGKEVSKAQILEIIGKPAIRDDSKQLALTVIGAESERKAVLADLDSAPALAALKGKVKVQDYDPSHWTPIEGGFYKSGHPTIYIQAPSGTVLHRQDEYRGPEALAEALYKADPSYNPEKDPDLNKPKLLDGSLGLDDLARWVGELPGWAWAFIGGFAVLLWTQKEGEE